jgi:hypothetical protein
MTETAIERAASLLRGDTTSLDEVLKALVTDPTEQIAIPKAAKKVELSDEAHRALAVLHAVFGRVQPDCVRALTEAELEQIGEEALVLEAILDPIRTRHEAIKEIMRSHLDRSAEESGRVTPETPKDNHGHYVLGRPKNPETLRIPGTNRRWSSSYRSGKVTLSHDELLRLFEAGEIDLATYRSFTKEVRQRVLDEDKVYKAVKKSPSLLGLVARITKRGLPGSALTIAKQ